ISSDALLLQLWIPLGRFVQYQYAPTIHEVLMGAALRQQASVSGMFGMASVIGIRVATSR
ncbi:hypothetical protein OE88DRAFT_1666328, partial [Heliocybe sulcata]